MKFAYILMLVGAVFLSSKMVMDIAGQSSTAPNNVVAADVPTREPKSETVHVDPAISQRVHELLHGDSSDESAQSEMTSADSQNDVPGEPVADVTVPEAVSELPSTIQEHAEPLIKYSQPIRQKTALHDQMVTPGNFEYVGAFRPPLSDAAGKRFSYGGWGVTFRDGGDSNGDNDGHPGSLFIVGHRHHQLVAEISIPRPVISLDHNIDDLPVANVIQQLGDVTGGIRKHLSGESSEPFEIGGMQVVNDRLHWTLYKYYNVEGHNYYSHGLSTLDVTHPSAKGLWHLGPVNSGDQRWHSYKHGGYICEVPEPFATQYLGGRNLLSGLQISTGRQYSSQGPALFAYRLPDKPPQHGAALNALPMLWYPMNSRVAGHHGADLWKGAAWLTVGDKQAIVFVGRKAHGPERYGQALPTDCYDYKGYHGDSYEIQMLFYAPGDLVQATSRAVPNVQPWYRWDSTTAGGGLNRFMFQKCGKEVGGLAYDRARNLVYISEIDAGFTAENEWESLPVIHVLRLVN